MARAYGTATAGFTLFVVVVSVRKTLAEIFINYEQRLAMRCDEKHKQKKRKTYLVDRSKEVSQTTLVLSSHVTCDAMRISVHLFCNGWSFMKRRCYSSLHVLM